mmetsp:Transcript_10714/g.25303  ORF Transcript_10714/g.25303 Transcript_10714/m.25303 type:complete len:266 (+) Transcript_10714:1472-2269(+)
MASFEDTSTQSCCRVAGSWVLPSSISAGLPSVSKSNRRPAGLSWTACAASCTSEASSSSVTPGPPGYCGSTSSVSRPAVGLQSMEGQRMTRAKAAPRDPAAGARLPDSKDKCTSKGCHKVDTCTFPCAVSVRARLQAVQQNRNSRLRSNSSSLGAANLARRMCGGFCRPSSETGDQAAATPCRLFGLALQWDRAATPGLPLAAKETAGTGSQTPWHVLSACASAKSTMAETCWSKMTPPFVWALVPLESLLKVASEDCAGPSESC